MFAAWMYMGQDVDKIKIINIIFHSLLFSTTSKKKIYRNYEVREACYGISSRYEWNPREYWALREEKSRHEGTFMDAFYFSSSSFLLQWTILFLWMNFLFHSNMCLASRSFISFKTFFSQSHFYALFQLFFIHSFNKHIHICCMILLMCISRRKRKKLKQIQTWIKKTAVSLIKRKKIEQMENFFLSLCSYAVQRNTEIRSSQWMKMI